MSKYLLIFRMSYCISPLTGRKSCKEIDIDTIDEFYLEYQSPDGAKVLQDNRLKKYVDQEEW